MSRRKTPSGSGRKPPLGELVGCLDLWETDVTPWKSMVWGEFQPECIQAFASLESHIERDEWSVP